MSCHRSHTNSPMLLLSKKGLRFYKKRAGKEMPLGRRWYIPGSRLSGKEESKVSAENIPSELQAFHSSKNQRASYYFNDKQLH